jgi:hypothetical protein
MDMKKLLLFAALVSAFAASDALGAVVAHDDISMAKINNAGGTFANNGGPFTATVYDDNGRPQGPGSWVGASPSALTSFLTFCVEVSNTFSYGTHYDIAAVAVESVNGGKFLTGYAAWVYNEVLTSGLSAVASANKEYYETAQLAIWAGMTAAAGGSPGSAGSEYVTANITNNGGDGTGVFNTYNFGLNDFTASGWGPLTELNGYMVMNIQDNGGGFHQDMFLGRPEGPLAAVPEPASIVVWSVLAGGAAGFAVRKRRQRGPAGRWNPEDRQAILSVIERGPTRL